MIIATGFLIFYLNLKKRVDSSQYDTFHSRFYGRVSELLLDVWINKNGIKYEEVKVIDMQNVNWLKKELLFKSQIYWKKI